jgi:hypothetical protein
MIFHDDNDNDDNDNDDDMCILCISAYHDDNDDNVTLLLWAQCDLH